MSFSYNITACLIKDNNINSLIPHTACLIKDNIVPNTHVTCLLETWLLPKDEHPLFLTFNTLRRNRYESSGGKSTTVISKLVCISFWIVVNQ
jgi:hypothetical protein